MAMQVISVNRGKAQPVDNGKGIQMSGIYKEPVNGPVEITSFGLLEDTVVNTRHHGGPDQAVYIYGGADYDFWREALGQPLLPGTFGENLTISELESAGYAAGDRLAIGQVLLEVTSPRIPCDTFAARMGDPGFIDRFRLAERPGLYCRVIQPGTVEAGAKVIRQAYAGERVTMLELFRTYYEADLSTAVIARQIAAPVAYRVRQDRVKKLKKS